MESDSGCLQHFFPQPDPVRRRTAKQHDHRDGETIRRAMAQDGARIPLVGANSKWTQQLLKHRIDLHN